MLQTTGCERLSCLRESRIHWSIYGSQSFVRVVLCPTIRDARTTADISWNLLIPSGSPVAAIHYMSLGREPPMTQPSSVLISEPCLRAPSALGLIMSLPGRQLRVSPRRRRLLLLLLLLLLPFVFAGRRRVFVILLSILFLLLVLCGKSLKRRRYLKLQGSLIVRKSVLRAWKRSSIN